MVVSSAVLWQAVCDIKKADMSGTPICWCPEDADSTTIQSQQVEMLVHFPHFHANTGGQFGSFLKILQGTHAHNYKN